MKTNRLLTASETTIQTRDILWKGMYKDGTEGWLLVHIEVQGYKDKSFPERMFTYFYRIRDRYQREVISLAIFTDNDEKYHPNKYVYERCGTSLIFHFNTYKVKTQDKALLEQSDNPFAISETLRYFINLRKRLIVSLKIRHIWEYMSKY